MSACRMCDDCGTVFSERAEGWWSGNGAVRRRNPQTGEVRVVIDEIDTCPECTERRAGGPTRPMLATTVSPRYEADIIEPGSPVPDR